jgi:hypothetical protein
MDEMSPRLPEGLHLAGEDWAEDYVGSISTDDWHRLSTGKKVGRAEDTIAWEFDGWSVQVQRGDCARLVPPELAAICANAQRAGEWVRGLAYVDDNGEPSWDTMVRIKELCPYLDILIYYSANMRKRVRCCGKTYMHDQLLDLLALLDKPHWLVREPTIKKEWTFLLGSRYDRLDPIRRLGFWPADSERGKAILRELNFTDKELAALPIEGQLPLFGDGDGVS